MKDRDEKLAQRADQQLEGLMDEGHLDLVAIGDLPNPDGDNPDLSVLREFANPGEWRTMARAAAQERRLAAIVHAKGAWLGSSLRTAFVEDSFLMSRSEDGWGSNQMVQIAARPRGRESEGVRRFFGMRRSREA